MGEVVPFRRHLTGKLDDLTATLSEALAAADAPDPSALGWLPLDHDDQGRAIRWHDVPTGASIGYVPGEPELVYLDYRHEVRVFEWSIGELAVGVQTGFLPKPLFVLDWAGRPLP